MHEPLCSTCYGFIHEGSAILPGDAEVDALAEFFTLLGSPSRLKILLALDGGELCAGHLAQAVSMSPSAVSNQLKVLRAARLISVRREGKMLFYSLADCHPRAIIRLAASHVNEE